MLLKVVRQDDVNVEASLCEVVMTRTEQSVCWGQAGHKHKPFENNEKIQKFGKPALCRISEHFRNVREALLCLFPFFVHKYSAVFNTYDY